MKIHIVLAAPGHADAVGRIVFEAFDDIARRHAFLPEIPNAEMAIGLAHAFIGRPDVYGVVAVSEDGAVIGSNFVQLTDAVAGVGPITVDPKRQCKGVGRQLMRNVIEHSLRRGPQIRLLQEATNMASMSLYQSLGFDVKEPVLIMSVPPMADVQTRPMTHADVDAADTLCVSTQNVSRRNEIDGMIAMGPQMMCIPHARFDAAGRMTAFVIPGFFGFAGALTAEDLLVTAQVAVAPMPPMLQRIMVPARNGELFRTALNRGFKSVKLMQLMAMGPYSETRGHWCPSIAY